MRDVQIKVKSLISRILRGKSLGIIKNMPMKLDKML